ncbi:unnamed protein product [Bemisia tabaci]|uniref:Uncharacterized protein n=1 Tax=Bemisia tabaci TaxID=7038 RepID=A0A9P0AGT0_BEMTA|nr:unnamed protein product [Bemisia tabaci]
MDPCERNTKNFRRHDFVFVGEVQDKFKRSKLPNNRETLQVLFNEIQINGKTINDSIWHTTKLIVPFWTKISRIPIIQEIKIFGKLKKLYEEWRLLKKNRLRKSASQISKEAKFQERLEELFDIARSDALTKMENEEDKQFLTQQRLPGRPGTITQRKDVKLATEECALLLKRRRSDERKEQRKRFKETYEKRNSYVQVDQEFGGLLTTITSLELRT